MSGVEVLERDAMSGLLVTFGIGSIAQTLTSMSGIFTLAKYRCPPVCYASG
jgi:hypothetical protein